MSTGRILVCRCCGEPLRVVCPTHGTEHLTVSWPADRPTVKLDTEPRIASPSRRAPEKEAGGRTVRRDKTPLRQQFLDVLRERQGAVKSVTMLAGTLRISGAHVGVIANELLKAGRIERVGRGLYRLAERAA